METAIKKAASRILPALVFAILFTWAAWAAQFTGPKSKYYLKCENRNTIYVVQGTKVIASFPTAYGGGYWEGNIAVSQTIRTRASMIEDPNILAPSGEYTLAGDPTGYSYYSPVIPWRSWDGTTDGINTYILGHNNGDVYRADYYWQNSEWLFNPRELCPFGGCDGGFDGIAYDLTNNSLWISSGWTGLVGDYSLDGELLAIFDGGALGLAVDPADHTLWGGSYDYQSGKYRLMQYSLDPPTLGQVLQSGLVTGVELCGLAGAGEFQVVQCDNPPIITSLAAVPSVLWPPDRRMAPVELKVTTSLGCGEVSCRIASVTSSEPADRNSGNWTITGDLTLNLRAAHLDQGPGRIYAITVRCNDAFAHRTEGTVYVAVPREALR